MEVSHKFDAIADVDLEFTYPGSLDRMEFLVDFLALKSKSLVLDLQCGKGELLISVLERFKCFGIGIEQNPSFLMTGRAEAAARLPKERITFHEAEAYELDLKAETYHCVIVVDADPFGDLEMTLQKVWAITRSGGICLIGARYWRQPPPPEYLDFIGRGENAYETHAGNMALAVQESFTPIYTCAVTQDEMDDFEGRRLRAVERFLRANPGDTHANAFRERIRAYRDGYLKWGRDAVGFGYYLLMK